VLVYDAPGARIFFSWGMGDAKILALGFLQVSSADLCAAGEPGDLPLGYFS